MDEPLNIEELLEHEDFVRGLAHRLVFGGDRVDDVVQSTWLAALKKPPKRGPGEKAWLATLVRNVVRQQWRTDERRRLREERVAARGAISTPDELLEREELRRRLIEAVRELDSPHRDVILLRFFEGLPPRDIAKHLGVPVETVKTRLKRATARLRERLDDRHGGDRRAWQISLIPLCLIGPTIDVASGASAPVAASIGKGILMTTKSKLAIAAFCIALLFFIIPKLGDEGSPSPQVGKGERSETSNSSNVRGGTEDPAEPGAVASFDREGGERSADSSSNISVAVSDTHTLHLFLEGVPEEEASATQVTITGALPPLESWPVQTLAASSWRRLESEEVVGEFPLDSLLSVLAERGDSISPGEFELTVDHPAFFRATTTISLSSSKIDKNGSTIYEARAALIRPEYWPEFTLSVLDAQTRAHLEDIEVRISSGQWMAMWGRNHFNNLLAEGLQSPIPLMGGRDATEAERRVAGMALRPPEGESPHLVELERRFAPGSGVRIEVRAPGYAWGEVTVDVSKGSREVLLDRATILDIQLTNAQLDAYAALEVEPRLCVYWIRKDNGNQYVHFEALNEELIAEGLQLENLTPGGYRVSVELGGGSWTKRPVLALEELSGERMLAVGESRKLVLNLADPPAPPELATLAGVISFPASTHSWAEETVSLHLYHQPTQRWRRPHVNLPLVDLKRVGGALPSWSFAVDDLPVGMYRVQLMPFLKVWMIELTAEGSEDLELQVPEIAEVVIETVDQFTGERIPRTELHYRNEEPPAGQRQRDFTQAQTEEPGRFRFWSIPGKVMVWPKWPTGPDRDPGSGVVFDFKPGVQEVRLELEPLYAMKFVFREGGEDLPAGDPGMRVRENIRAVDHDGRILRDGLQRDMLVEVSAAGTYEISFASLSAERYEAIPSRQVEVRAGEVTEVIVELQRR